jgi:hypothetical protein
VRTLESKKEIPRFKLEGSAGKGGKVLFKKSELDLWMETKRVNSGQDQDLVRLADEALRAVCSRK